MGPFCFFVGLLLRLLESLSGLPTRFFGGLLEGILLGLGEIIPGLPSSLPTCFFGSLLLGLWEILTGLPSSFFGGLLEGILLGLGEIISGLPSCFFAGILLCLWKILPGLPSCFFGGLLLGLWKIIPGLAPKNLSTIFHCHPLTSCSNAHSSTSKLFLLLLLSSFLSHPPFTHLPFLLF